MEGILRRGEEEVEDQHTSHGREHIARPGGGGHGGQQYRQQIDGDDVRLGKADPGKGIAQHGGRRKDTQGNDQVPQSRPKIYSPRYPPGAVGGIRMDVRDDVDVDIRRIGGKLVRQGGLAPGMLPGHGASADDDLRHPGEPGVLGDLVGHIIPKDRLHPGSQTLGKAGMVTQPLPVRFRHDLIIGGLDKQCREPAPECLGHRRRRADDLGVGRCRGQAGQNMIPFHGAFPLSMLSF